MPGLINDRPIIEKFVDSIDGYDNLELVIESTDTAKLIQKNKEAIVEAYNLSGFLKDEMRIFALMRIKL